MARGKKAAKELTAEEKLEQALVPVDEQPYPVPENWCWVRFSSVIELISGRDAALSACNNRGVGIPYILGASNIENNTYTIERWIEKPQVISQKGDILLSVKGTIGKLYLQKEDEINISRQIMAIRPVKFLNGNVVYLFLQSICEELCEAGNGLIPGISRTDILNKAFPFMPLAEQQRIVDRIESIFAKLDEAKEKAQAVVDGFELRKSAILHKAFTGELTEKWRQEHGVTMDSWKTKRINEITKPRAGYAFDSKKFTNSGYQIIRMGNLYGGKLDLSRTPVFISEDDVDETALKRALINNGDILITLTGTKYKRDYGYAVCIIDPVNLLVNQRILCLTPSQDIEKNYVLYYLRSNIFRDIFFSNETGGVNQGNVSSKFVENIEIKVPSFAEQHEIVTILDRLAYKEQQAKEAAESVLARIDIIKKSVLARAFRGELDTNDPTEESAVELLKRTLDK